MTIASIDIGTNTVLLLVAEVDALTRKIIPVRNEYRMPRIGKDTKKTGLINKDRLTLLYDVIKEYKAIIDNYSCDKVILTGTNAFRIAKNTSDIVEVLKDIYNFDLNIISGEEEAEYAYLGAVSNLEDLKGVMVIDIGGSSTEIIYGEGLNISIKKSLQLGSVSATERYFKNAPPTLIELQKFGSYIKSIFSALEYKIDPKQVIAIAGTATTIACMISGLKEYEEDKVDKRSISTGDVKNILSELNTLTTAEILHNYGPVMKGREDIIFAGAFILYQFMKKFEIENICVSTRGIRYGAIVKFINSYT